MNHVLRELVMDTHPELSMLAAQIECARSRADQKRETREDVSVIESIIDTLRLNYASRSAGLDPRVYGPWTFVLEVNGHREPLVRHGERHVPVNDVYVKHLFTEAGLELVPGQVLLLDLALVRDLVEEALGDIGHEEAQIAKTKAELNGILARAPGFRMESVEAALDSTESMAERVRSRKVDLIAASLLASDGMEKTPSARLEASKESPAAAA
jgi:hypothetical protein